jgi:TPR repeat protein
MTVLRVLTPMTLLLCIGLNAQVPKGIPEKIPPYVLSQLTPEQQEGMQDILTKARAGEAESLFFLGNYYFDGKYGFPGNFAKGIACWQLAAAQGHVSAIWNLGNAYYNGNGVKRSVRKAFHYYRLAAEKDHIKALNRMGKAYETGEFVAKSLEKAEAFYLRAAEFRNASAIEALKRIRNAKNNE